jgi:hypothetical protein
MTYSNKKLFEKKNFNFFSRFPENIYYAWLSVYQNYKWWISALICLFVLNQCQINKKYLYSFLTFISIMIYSQIFHYLLHVNTFYPMNVIHVYHHSVSSWLSNFLEIIFESIVLFYPLMTFYLYYHYLHFFNIQIKWIDELVSICDYWTIVFYMGFYVTMHNINYSILKVNHIHRIHHEELLRNMSPDIFDILFFTKDDITDVENMDHMILNLYISLVFALILQKIYNSSIIKESHICLGFLVFLFLKGIITTILFIQQTNYEMNLECDLFKKDFQNHCIPKWNGKKNQEKKIENSFQKIEEDYFFFNHIQNKIYQYLFKYHGYLLFSPNIEDSPMHKSTNK